jgi:hypothetical protein
MPDATDQRPRKAPVEQEGAVTEKPEGRRPANDDEIRVIVKRPQQLTMTIPLSREFWVGVFVGALGGMGATTYPFGEHTPSEGGAGTGEWPADAARGGTSPRSVGPGVSSSPMKVEWALREIRGRRRR